MRLEQPEKANSPIFVTDGGMEILVRLLQPSKAPPPISVTDGGMEMLVRLEQPQKASFPISVTDSGMEMLVRLEQSQKASSPITVTDGGMVVFSHPLISVLLSVCIMALQSSRESYTLFSLETTMLVRLLQSEKALSPILFVHRGKVISSRQEHMQKALSSISSNHCQRS